MTPMVRFTALTNYLEEARPLACFDGLSLLITTRRPYVKPSTLSSSTAI